MKQYLKQDLKKNLKQKLEQMLADCQIYEYDVIDSTNIQAKRLAVAGACDKTLVLARAQTDGRGRRGRTWESSGGDSVCMSLLLRPDFAPDRASMLTLVMGLSAVEGLEQELGVKTQIKWPNDVVYNKKKLVGILTEMGLQTTQIGPKIDYIVIGIGINTNMVEFPEELLDKATSLRLELGYEIDHARLISAVVNAFWRNYQIFLETGDLTGLKARYEAVMVNQNQPVRVLQPGCEYEGIAVGINTMGELLVERLDGTCEAVYAGEVSVRGIYGYT